MKTIKLFRSREVLACHCCGTICIELSHTCQFDGCWQIRCAHGPHDPSLGWKLLNLQNLFCLSTRVSSLFTLSHFCGSQRSTPNKSDGFDGCEHSHCSVRANICAGQPTIVLTPHKILKLSGPEKRLSISIQERMTNKKSPTRGNSYHRQACGHLSVSFAFDFQR